MALRLEVGKFYRTRDGRKVRLRAENRTEWRFNGEFVGTDGVDCWRSDGTRSVNDGDISPADIVSEWIDESAKPAETELERLVRVANEGFKAIGILGGRWQEVEFVDTKNPGFNLSGEFRKIVNEKLPVGCFGSWQLQVKPRPVFEPFRVGAGNWEVKLSDDGKTLSVGCQSFQQEELRATLKRLCAGGWKPANTSGGTIHGNRIGVLWRPLSTEANYSVLWADADRILAALEKYFGEDKKEAA